MRYDGPVVDAHQHFWDPGVNDHPWLRPAATIPFRYGNYDAIKRRYLPPDYWEDARGAEHPADGLCRDGVEPRRSHRRNTLRNRASGTVRRAECDRGASAGSIGLMWLRCSRVIPRSRWCAACDTSRAAQLHPGGQGRHSCRTTPGGAGTRCSSATGCTSTCKRHGGIRQEAAGLARDFPGTTMILNHTGLPSDRSEAGLAGWRSAMAGFAEQPNVRVKISGLGEAGQPWTVHANGWIVRETIAMFGPNRCMFASNFPVDSLCASFATIFDGFREIVQDLPFAAQARLFCGTAREVYGLERPSSAVETGTDGGRLQ